MSTLASCFSPLLLSFPVAGQAKWVRSRGCFVLLFRLWVVGRLARRRKGECDGLGRLLKGGPRAADQGRNSRSPSLSSILLGAEQSRIQFPRRSLCSRCHRRLLDARLEVRLVSHHRVENSRQLWCERHCRHVLSPPRLDAGRPLPLPC